MTSAADMAVLFDHFDDRASFLGDLDDWGRIPEAQLLCACYIEAWGGAAFPGERSSRRRFVRVLRKYGNAQWLHAVSPGQLLRSLDGSPNGRVRALGERMRSELERLAASVMNERDLRDALSPACSENELQILDSEIWGGSLASMAYRVFATVPSTTYSPPVISPSLRHSSTGSRSPTSTSACSLANSRVSSGDCGTFRSSPACPADTSI